MKAKACKAKGKHSTSSKRGAKIAARRGAEGMEIVNPQAGGIDCGAQEHYVAVPPQSVEPGEPVVRCFSAFTEGLDALVEWLKACGVTTVAIEATGVYWIALCQKLEAAGIEVAAAGAGWEIRVPRVLDTGHESHFPLVLAEFLALVDRGSAPPALTTAIRALKGIVSICAPLPSQWAGVAALTGPQDCVEDMRRIYDERRQVMLAGLDAMGIPYAEPQGAFYVYAKVAVTGVTATEFCERLLAEGRVMMYPGPIYGDHSDDYVRISLTQSVNRIGEAMRRMAEVVQSIRREAA